MSKLICETDSTPDEKTDDQTTDYLDDRNIIKK